MENFSNLSRLLVPTRRGVQSEYKSNGVENWF